jgi:hypothetical protein
MPRTQEPWRSGATRGDEDAAERRQGRSNGIELAIRDTRSLITLHALDRHLNALGCADPAIVKISAS